MTITPIANTVVWRHPCDCAHASRPLEAGEEAEHRFDVNGEPFPWHIAEAGATFTKRGTLYLVSVCVFPLKRHNNEPVEFSIDLDGRPSIGGVLFPWALTGPLSIVATPREIPILDLTFVTRELDTDAEVTEEPLDDDEGDDRA